MGKRNVPSTVYIGELGRDGVYFLVFKYLTGVWEGGMGRGSRGIRGGEKERRREREKRHT